MDFEINGKGYRTHCLRGAVVQVDKFTESHVDHSGYGNTVQLRTFARTNIDLWLRDADGRDVPVQLHDVDIPLRIGHEVSVISVQDKDGGADRPVAVVDHAAGATHRLVRLEDAPRRLAAPVYGRALAAAALGAVLAGLAGVAVGPAAGSTVFLFCLPFCVHLAWEAKHKAACRSGERIQEAVLQAVLEASRNPTKSAAPSPTTS